MSKEGLVEKVTFEQRRQGGEGPSQMALWGKSIPAQGISQGNGLERGAGSGACLTGSRNSKEARMAGGE